MQAHWATADPANRDGDRVWWNWCRMPAAASTGAGDPASVAMIAGVTQHLSLLLDRDVQASRPGSALATRWSRPSPERRRATA